MNYGNGEEKTVKIPIRIVNGSIKYFYGGELPQIIDGAIGELVLQENALYDDRFIKIAQMENEVQILPKGSIIMVGVDSSQTPEILRPHLRNLTLARTSLSYGMATNNDFVEVRLKEPLKLLLRGSKKSSLKSVRCFIECLKKEAESLNDAYSKISTDFEPQRRSHTGNAFQKCWYNHNNEWLPIEALREQFESKYEEKLFLDYKIFELEHDKMHCNNDIEGNECMIIDAMLENGGRLTGTEIKNILKQDKQEYIDIIISLIRKGIIKEVENEKE